MAADRGTDVSAALAEQLLALVAEQCAIQPTVLVVDDLQWADPASVTLWGRLARTVQQVPLLLVGMMRPVPRREDLLALRRVASDALRLRLNGLDEAAVAQLVTSRSAASRMTTCGASPMGRRATRCMSSSWSTRWPAVRA